MHSNFSLPPSTNSSRNPRLFYPVTDTHAESSTYSTYKNGPHLTATLLRWMYAAFFHDNDGQKSTDRVSILGSPLLFTPEQAASQPSTLMIVASVDPLQEEGKKFGHLLQKAGVEVAVLEADGQVHDFVMLEATRGSATARAVIELAGLKLRRALI
jgi:acetyl esterase